MAPGVESEGDYRDGLSPADRLKIIANIWGEIRISGYAGATDWATLEEMEREVTEIMYGDAPDVDRAESLTFMAFHSITGSIES